MCDEELDTLLQKYSPLQRILKISSVSMRIKVQQKVTRLTQLAMVTAVRSPLHVVVEAAVQSIINYVLT